MTKVQRYKVGYYTDEWGMSSNTPCLIPDDSGYAVKFEDYCKLETELAALKAENESLRKDAERLNFIQSNCRCDPMMDGQHKWWPTNFNKCLTGPSIRAAIDAAMAKGETGMNT